MAKEILVVALMNPGEKYRCTRHNAGAMALDILCDTVVYKEQKGLSALTAAVVEGDIPLVLLKPLTFMNLSGQSVKAAMRKFSVPVARVVVLHDEVELKIGEVRYKFGGGHKGHNGLRSIIADIGTADFHRIRIGVGRPTDADAGIADYLLAFQPPEERAKKEQLLPVWNEALNGANNA
ncbi:MAG: aminoacyl-tRNA hydrolase [Spirochaetes bacterium]|nr:aminoacyl-tRNA hydrolase [Spirochaetota bacterium]